MPVTGAYSTGVGENPPIEAPQVTMVVQVPVNIFMGKFRILLASLVPRFEFWWNIDTTDKSPLFIGKFHILRSGAI